MKSASKKVVMVALVANLMIAIIKFVVTLISNSSAMFAEAVHSLADTGNQVLLLIGFKNSKKPPDAEHPFGYGQEQYFWSFMVAILIFFVGSIVSIYEGIHKLMHPEEITSAWMIYIILGVSFCIEGYALSVAVREFNKTRAKNVGLFEAVVVSKDMGVAVVLFEDTAALMGLSVAFVGVLLAELTGIIYFDAASSIVIGVILAVVAFLLAKETKGLLIGESASLADIEAIRKCAIEFEEIEQVGEIITMHMGPDNILVIIKAEFMDDLTSDDLEIVIDQLQNTIQKRVPAATKIFIEADRVILQRH